MMVWSLFIIGLMGLFFYNKRDYIIPTVVLPTTEIIEPFKWTTAIGSVAQYALFKSAGAAVKSIRKSSISSADDVSLKTNLDNDVVDLSSSKSNNLTLKTGSDLSIPKTQNHVDVPSSAKSHVNVSTSGVADAELTKVKHTADLNLSTKSSVNVPTSKTADIDLPTVKSYTDMNLSSKTVSNAATAAAVSGVKPGDVDVPKVKAVSDVEAPKYNKEQIQKKDLRPYTGDLMNPIEAKRYSDYWRSKGMGTEETWQDFKKNIPNGTIDDYNKILYEQDPWPLNVKPSFKILKGGDTFEMAMAPHSKQLDPWPGNFATDINTISDSQYVRDRLAVKYNWKPDIDRVVQYRVREGNEIPANVGPIGPQIDLEINRYLPGGPNQSEMLMGGEKINYLEIIGIRNIK